ncbi:metalloprotease 1 [Beauveria brongniartii RCEF 3172]|uniref:Metalloprotease 1 n=1 Tax=Beauveria brongniartii RCEF 3172 TaxID=1081107 RepID=A0A167EXQ9_9HYPO|nr:metalloprotease 1 [Beauveria brongniartii RCEF 3172]
MAFKKSLVVAATMAVAAFGAALEGFQDCASTEPSAELLAAAEEMAAQEATVDKINTRADGDVDVIVPTYLHVIASSESKGYLSTEDVIATIDGMNSDFKGLGFQFDVQNATHTINSTWAANQDPMVMKRQLRKGDYKTLNMYFVPTFPTTGGCPFPLNVTADSIEFWRDGCTLLSSTHNKNHITTHEVGHWLGLLHTFEGNCDKNNDYVADTPAMQMNYHTCNKTIDTCPDMPGNDPVNNFMSYGDCIREFTPGQVTRMKSMYQKFRA